MRNIETIRDQRFLSILSEVKEELLKLFGDKLRQLILFGSYARDEQDLESDIDIMILVDDSDDTLRQYNHKISDIMADLSLKHDKLISLTEETYNRYNQYLDILPFFRNVNDEGIEIYGKIAA
jgi:predicted nucleotidyltransferase